MAEAPEQLFPLTFKGNSTISNLTQTAWTRLNFEYYDDEGNQYPPARTPIV